MNPGSAVPPDRAGPGKRGAIACHALPVLPVPSHPSWRPRTERPQVRILLRVFRFRRGRIQAGATRAARDYDGRVIFDAHMHVGDVPAEFDVRLDRDGLVELMAEHDYGGCDLPSGQRPGG